MNRKIERETKMIEDIKNQNADNIKSIQDQIKQAQMKQETVEEKEESNNGKISLPISVDYLHELEREKEPKSPEKLHQRKDGIIQIDLTEKRVLTEKSDHEKKLIETKIYIDENEDLEDDGKALSEESNEEKIINIQNLLL